MQITYTKNCTKIYDSYLLKSDIDIHAIITEIIDVRWRKGLPMTRDFNSYFREIKAHNRLYRLGIARSHTKDVDLEEHNSKLMEIVWRIIGG